MPQQTVLTLPTPPPGQRIPYGTETSQFGELRLPEGKGPFPVLMNIHGGYWRAQYDLGHAGHLCAALTTKGVATWNLEYRRVGNTGGGWPGSFADIRNGYRMLSQLSGRYRLDLSRTLIMGHSAGAQLALCLAGHEPGVTRALSLAGVVDLEQAWELHLSSDAVVDFLGGTPKQVPEHYQEADPMQLRIAAVEWLIHGAPDDTVPASISRNYAEQKKARGEQVHYLEIATASHLDLIDPHSAAWPKVESTALHLLLSAG